MTISGPSEKAIEAGRWSGDMVSESTVEQVLQAAHDPALGLDRSVCLRDVVEALRADRRFDGAEFIEREFGGERAERTAS